MPANVREFDDPDAKASADPISAFPVPNRIEDHAAITGIAEHDPVRNKVSL